MNVYIYTEGVKKSKGEEILILQPLAELEDFATVDAALEALVDEAPDLLGTEFVIFTQEPEYITVEPPPETKYAMTRRNGGAEVAYEEDEVEPEEEAPVVKRPAKKRPAKKPAAKAKAAAKKRPASKKPAAGSRAGARVGSSKRTPFTRNASSAD